MLLHALAIGRVRGDDAPDPSERKSRNPAPDTVLAERADRAVVDGVERRRLRDEQQAVAVREAADTAVEEAIARRHDEAIRWHEAAALAGQPSPCSLAPGETHSLPAGMTSIRDDPWWLPPEDGLTSKQRERSYRNRLAAVERRDNKWAEEVNHMIQCSGEVGNGTQGPPEEAPDQHQQPR